MNNATFAGRIGRDAEVRHTGGGKPVAGFSLAVDEYAGQGEKKTLWIDCSLWGDRAEKLAQYLAKGTPVAVSGQVGIRVYESNGQTKSTLTLRVAELTLLGKPEGSREQAPSRQARGVSIPASATNHGSTRGEPPADDFDDSIPF